MIRFALLLLLIAAAFSTAAMLWTCRDRKASSPLPSIYVTGEGTDATCYADGKHWKARVDGKTINCYAADMPKDH